MIELIFEFAGDYVLVKIQGWNITFGNTNYGTRLAPIECLRLDRSGVMNEFPDLKDDPNWRDEAIKRFKDKIKHMRSEEQIAEYIIEDLKKFGYIPKWKQKGGFRKEGIS